VTERLLEHHDALRLRFHRDESGWRQVNAVHGGEIPFAFVDLTTAPEADRADAILEKASELQASLNLSEGPLLRICLFSLGENTCRLLVITHHLVMDGMSWRILLEDMRQAYRQLSEGQEAKLAQKTTSFKRWAELLMSYAQSSEARREMSYWHGELSKDFAGLPVDHVNAENVEASARTVSVSLTPEETHALLHEVPAAYRTQINDALLTALAQALWLWTKQPRALMELEGHGREDVLEGVELSRTVGWFTTAFPLALKVESKGDIGEDLRRVKEQLRAIPGRGLGFGLLRYMTEGYESAERLRGSIRPEVSFNYLGQLDQALDEGSAFGLAKESIGPTHSGRAMRTHLLEVEASIIDGQLQVVWGYSENMHRRQTVESLAHDYICSLRKLIAHCRSGEARGFTPSDFPEARLTQKDLDRLIAGLSGAGKE
jgi:non-ribosomal peptide synthase protein (TIGR01720 family)